MSLRIPERKYTRNISCSEWDSTWVGDSSEAAALSAVIAWNDARVTEKELSKLSARELDDIGLCYGDIKDIANRRF